MKTTQSQNTTRRSAMKKTASAAFGFSVLPSYLALGKPDGEGNVPPSQRINLACIGTAGRANSVIPSLCSGGHAQVVALADVDANNLNSQKNQERSPDAKKFKDFRVMLDKMGDDIDAVSVVTPDHTHYVATLAAMQLGKHVYVEKPLTHSYKEADNLMKAEEKYGVVTQMGNQGHTSTGSEQFKHLVDKGIIKDIVKIEAWKSPSLWFMKPEERKNGFPLKMSDVPGHVDWDLWCGPAPMEEFCKQYHPFGWRAFYLYGLGMLGDWGAHIIDFAHHWLDMRLPTKIDAITMEDHNQVIFPLVTRLGMHFPARGDKPPIDLTWHDGAGFEPDVNEKFWDSGSDGAKKKPNLGGAGTLLYQEDGDYVVHRNSHGSASRIYPRVEMMKYKDDIKVAGPELDHLQSFTQACMGNGKTSSPFSVAAPLTKVLTLGVVAQYLNENLEFDPETETFKGNAAANDLLSGPAPRKGWEGYYESV